MQCKSSTNSQGIGQQQRVYRYTMQFLSSIGNGNLISSSCFLLSKSRRLDWIHTSTPGHTPITNAAMWIWLIFSCAGKADVSVAQTNIICAMRVCFSRKTRARFPEVDIGTKTDGLIWPYVDSMGHTINAASSSSSTQLRTHFSVSHIVMSEVTFCKDKDTYLKFFLVMSLKSPRPLFRLRSYQTFCPLDLFCKKRDFLVAGKNTSIDKSTDIHIYRVFNQLVYTQHYKQVILILINGIQ